jgi:hypothetical protein
MKEWIEEIGQAQAAAVTPASSRRIRLCFMSCAPLVEL